MEETYAIGCKKRGRRTFLLFLSVKEGMENSGSPGGTPADAILQRPMTNAGAFSGAVIAAIGSTLLALTRHHQTHAIIAKRLGPVRMPDHAREPLHIGRKPRFTIV